MVHISLEAKEALVQKVLNRGSATVQSIALANNVGYSSLMKWVRKYKDGQLPIAGGSHSKSEATRGEWFHHLLATAHLDDVSLGQYCREHGIYSHQLSSWRAEFMKPTESKPTNREKSELNKLRHENKRLQRELRRKEKALAEASALLIMKKKADLIWGESEDD